MRFSFVLCPILVGIIYATPIPQSTDPAVQAQTQAQTEGNEVVVVSTDNDSHGDKVTIEFNPQEVTQEPQSTAQTDLDPSAVFAQLWHLRRPNDDEHIDDAKYEAYEIKTEQEPDQLGEIDL
ncbi:secreted protein [Melampsora americana]|nr:secreted protein [Melampsora americana]